jgi:predicted HAD superfamily Cof-like phosphohydrolase
MTFPKGYNNPRQLRDMVNAQPFVPYVNGMEQAVKNFHNKFGLTINTVPTVPSQNDLALRMSLIEEEAREFREAAEKGDLVGMADAIADLLYVTFGAAVTCGINTSTVFNEVHRSNMTKIWPDGTVRHREDGKVLKPPTYSKADVSGVLGLKTASGT